MSTATVVPSHDSTTKPSPIYLAVLALFIVASLMIWPNVLTTSLSGRHAGTHDFISYWASGRQLIEHRDPYDPKAIFSLETSAGYPQSRRVMMMRNTPNALFLTLPVALMPARIAYICWFIFLLGCLAVSIETLANRDPYVRFLGYSFAPCLLCLVMGQTGIFPLLGIAIFLRLNERRPYIAGAFLALCLIKPHLMAPLMVVVVLWAWHRKRYAILAATTIAVMACCALPIYFDHAVWSDYARMIRSEGIEKESIPALGPALRGALRLRVVWPQLIPTAIASAWSIWHYVKHRAHWSWWQRMPLLVLVSLAVSPYAWFTDQAIAFAAIAIVKPKLDALLLVVMGIAYVAMLSPSHSQINMWLSVAWLGWYLYQARKVYEPPPVEEGAEIAMENA